MPADAPAFLLPCDVMLPGESVIPKGTPLAVLVATLDGRVALEDAMNRFRDPRAPKITPLPTIELTVQAIDYSYQGRLAGVAFKISGAIRYAVEDDNGRLFIHNAAQIGKEEGWLP
jgi:hypothetical protein